MEPGRRYMLKHRLITKKRELERLLELAIHEEQQIREIESELEGDPE